ncbi:MAG: ABC transporter ATP-binding protein [Anaerolineaceae bacterium]|nr:ABC transporter ATP-binding protein [Anaerolineaceae bacterium]
MPAETPLVIDHLSFRYRRRTEAAIKDVNFTLEAGQLMLVAGASGCGKTTLMRCINGLIPFTYHGEMQGDIRVFGRSVRGMSLAELSQSVGTLLQDPERQIVGSYVLNEVAFGLENLGFSQVEILARVEEVLAFLEITHLRDRETFSLSGGERQKVALAGVLAMRPRILLLDEPLANLDPASAAEALQLFRRLADEGMSILLVEHRIEDVLAVHPDAVLYLDAGDQIYQGEITGLLKVIDYHRLKLPAQTVLERARGEAQTAFEPVLKGGHGESLVRFENVSFQYNPDRPLVLQDINFTVRQGDVIAILGHNGAGKTTLVKHALGLLKPTHGKVYLENRDTRKTTVAQSAHTIGYVFQSPSQMLFAPSVAEELAFGPRNLELPRAEVERNVDWAIHTVHLEDELATPPLALSFGQQKRVSIAAILSMRSRILMMDEPTAGQDYWNYRAFMDAILQMPAFDAILFITHDVDLAVIYANRVLLLDNGKIMADGAPQDVLGDDALLRRCRVLPTSLLALNLRCFSQTGRFLRAETLANLPDLPG